MRRLTVVLTAACVLAVFGSTSPRADADCTVPTFTYNHAVVTFAERGQTTRVQVEIADSEASRETGLMCRTSLAGDAGMLFVFGDDTNVPFWMKNTLIPLSIAFMDSKLRIVGLFDMPVASDPSSDEIPTYGPKAKYRYALEVNQGFFMQHGIDTRAKVDIVPSPSGH
ncbi:MAG TPA: DUF192 domain-containing protein [bacterium]|nr:DUF192 domain-containing protein [bacterium]